MPIVYIYTEWYKSQPPEFEQRFPHIFAGVVMSMQLDGAMAGPMAELPAAPRRKTLRQRLRGPLMAAFPTALIFVGGGAYLADEPYVSTDNAFVRAAQDSINARVAGQVVEIAVEDDGPGIPEAYREKVFEPFFRLDGQAANDDGTGLGLTIARDVVLAHGGDLTLDRSRRGGLKALLRMPA